MDIGWSLPTSDSPCLLVSANPFLYQKAQLKLIDKCAHDIYCSFGEWGFGRTMSCYSRVLAVKVGVVGEEQVEKG